MASCEDDVQGVGQAIDHYVDQASQDHIDKACSDLTTSVPASRVATASTHQSREGSPGATNDYDSIVLFMTGEKAHPASREAEKWLRKQGPIWRNHGGKVVAFDDLDFDLQVGWLTYRTRPIDDVEKYIREMPKGQWSDHPSSETVKTRGLKRKRGDSRAEEDGVNRLQEWREGVEEGEDWKERKWTGEGLLVSRSSKIARCDGSEDVAHAEAQGGGEAARETSASAPLTHEALAALHQGIPSFAGAGSQDGGDGVEEVAVRVPIPHEIVGYVEKGNALAAFRMMPGIEGQLYPAMPGVGRCQLRCSETCKPSATISEGQAADCCLPSHARL